MVRLSTTVNPNALLVDASGKLNGTTVTGGSSWDGTVFQILITRQAATQSIIDQVVALSVQKVISSGQRNSLLAELENAIFMINKGKNTSAIQNLKGFISEVGGLEHSGMLTSSQGQPLISAADGVITQLQ